MRCLSAVGAIFILLLMMAPTFSAQFGMIDDHGIVRVLPKAGRLGLWDVPRQVAAHTDEGIGRFRPGYWFGQAIEEALAGHNVTWWYVDRFLLAAVVLLLIFRVAAQVVGPAPSAGVSLVPFVGPQFETFTRLGPNETYALPAAVAGLALIVLAVLRGRRRPSQFVAGYALLALAGLCKENFVVLTLGVLVVQILVLGGVELSKVRDRVAVAGVVLFSTLNLGAIFYQVRKYGTIYPQKRSLSAIEEKLLETFGVGDRFTNLSLGLIALTILTLMARTSVTRERSLAFPAAGRLLAAVFVFLVFPQVFLLAGTGFQGRYLYPTVLLYSLIWALVFFVAAANRSLIMGIASTFLLLLVLGVPVVSGFYQARALAAGNALATQQFQRRLQEIKQSADHAGVTVLVMQPFSAPDDYEPAVSIAVYMRKQFGLTSMVVPTTAPQGPFALRLNEDLRDWALHGNSDFRAYVPGPCISLIWGSSHPLCQTSVTIR